MVRLNQAGDLPGKRNRLSAPRCAALSDACEGKVAWSYTHYPLTARNVRIIKGMAPVVNVSTNSIAEGVRAYKRHRLPTVAVGPKDFRNSTIDGVRCVVCPAQLGGLRCKECGNGTPLCARRDRDYVIVFRAHGVGAKYLEVK